MHHHIDKFLQKMYNEHIRIDGRKGAYTLYLYQMGWHWSHPADFCIERPNGHFGMQIILIRTPAKVKMGGISYTVSPNTAFLVKSCLPHCLYANGCEYTDDWIRFSPEQNDHEMLDNLGLPWNEPIPLPDDTVSELIHSCVEIFESDMPNKNRILHHLMCAILLTLREYTKPKTAQKQNYYDQQLDALRKDIYSHPGKDWSIPVAAEELCISVSHFQRLYKLRYGISCSNDIFMSRMEYAKQLLLETELSASEIAAMCGYQSYENFSKAFSRYACQPPAKYRAAHKET